MAALESAVPYESFPLGKPWDSTGPTESETVSHLFLRYCNEMLDTGYYREMGFILAPVLRKQGLGFSSADGLPVGRISSGTECHVPRGRRACVCLYLHNLSLQSHHCDSTTGPVSDVQIPLPALLLPPTLVILATFHMTSDLAFLFHYL